jgi:ribosomal protein S18 acetylase RimI-like enzyme
VTASALGAWHIRPLLPGDRTALAELLATTGAFHASEVDVALDVFDSGVGVGGAPAADPDYHWIGCSVGQALAGCACFGPTPCTDGTFDLYWIATARAHQGRGVARTLLTYVEDEVERMSGRLIVMETSSATGSTAARAFYLSRGYALAAVVRDFYSSGSDRLILSRRMAASRLAIPRRAS